MQPIIRDGHARDCSKREMVVLSSRMPSSIFPERPILVRLAVGREVLAIVNGTRVLLAGVFPVPTITPLGNLAVAPLPNRHAEGNVQYR